MKTRNASSELSSSSTPGSGPSISPLQYWQLPAPLRRLFAKFPLTTLPANDLPERCPRNRETTILHIFSTDEDASGNTPSFNPACLKWQTYLKCSGIQFKTIAANNHASPSGVLPFLATGSSYSAAQTREIVPASGILKWTSSLLGVTGNAGEIRHEAYISLIDYGVRNAWLFALYLDDSNSQAIAKRLYIDPSSRNPLVRQALLRQLRKAALEELFKTRSSIREDELYLEAGKAFAGLSTLLGNDIYFFGRKRPTLFDASLFAYTEPLLDNSMAWQNLRLTDLLRRSENLMQHHHRLLNNYYGG